MKFSPFKLIFLLCFFAAISAYFIFDLQSLLSFEGLLSSVESIERYRDSNPLFVGLLFSIVYIAVTALSLPGATIMTLAGGALFGFGWGLLLASFASSIGATLAFLVSRFLLRDVVQSKFKDRLEAINRGVEKDGALYLFTLRLVPAFPFFVINILMGLTSIKTRTFYWVSQLGMLAGTAVYVNAGTQLAQLESTSGILSPELIVSFVLLGVFPLVAKRMVNFVKARQVYRRYKKPKKFDRNLIVIGAGAGGLVSAYIAAAVRAKVTLIESNKMGGDCLNYGCVPSKALISAAKQCELIRNAESLGFSVEQSELSFQQVMRRVEKAVLDIEPHDSVERYTKLGVDVVEGKATLIDPWTVEVDLKSGGKQTLTARSIVLATGAAPFVPPIPGLDKVGFVTSDTLWRTMAERDRAPERLVVLGGGPIGCELAQSFARLGSKVTLVEAMPQLMGREDADVSGFAKSALEQAGVKVMLAHKAVRCEQVENTKTLVLESEQGELNLQFDDLLCAVGRQARLNGYGLEELGVEAERTITTNPFLQTNFPNIFAVGDVVGPYQFTHVAAHQAWYAAVNALFGGIKKFKVDYRVIPWTTFLDPEIARVGVNEKEASEKGLSFEVYRYDISDLDRAITEGATKGFVKVLTPPGSDKILGVTIVAKNAGELLAEFVLAMKHGLGLNKILGTIHAYPTWAEANKYVAGEWKRANAPQKLLALLERFHQWRRK